LKPVVFLGPSLPHDEARKVLDADYRPPVKRGDLLTIGPEVRIVAIIDGVLMSDAAVGHREILTLMDSRITVIGGGSMGALRAAELTDLGMIGVGRIYEEYASHRVEGDDEVVLTYDPDSLSPLSEPLINLRLNLEEAVRRSIIDKGESQSILSSLRAAYFPERSYSLLLDISRRTLKTDKFEMLEKFILTQTEDFKRNDAIAVLRAVKQFLENQKKLTPVKNSRKMLDDS
jgi:hypothetical protein